VNNIGVHNPGNMTQASNAGVRNPDKLTHK